MRRIITKSAGQTKKFAEKLAKKILRPSEGRSDKNAVVIGLFGNLGVGKTVFCQGFAKGLGITKNIHSPTFIIMKKYQILNPESYILNSFVHIDVYRLENPKELADLGWSELIKNPRNIILVEWPDKIKKILPKDCIKIKFEHKGKNKRAIFLF